MSETTILSPEQVAALKAKAEKQFDPPCDSDPCDICDLARGVIALIAERDALKAEAAMILTGFDTQVFVRNIDGDGEPGWALKLLPFIGALGRLKQLVDSEPALSSPQGEPER